MREIHLFQPLTIKDVTFKNRIGVSPMCQYSAVDGEVNNWHLVHLGSRAIGGAGLVVVEATAVAPEGRISLQDCGLWNDLQEQKLRPIVEFLKSAGTVAAIQIGHAGRKASTALPWEGGGPLESGAWPIVGPSSIAFSSKHQVPHELTEQELESVVADFAAAAQRARNAGFQVLEVHAAHGYLLHSFLSPLSNQREDEYGGDLRNRMRFPLRVVEAVREVWPENLPLFVRISASDWVEGGWDLEQSVVLARELKALGVDLVDCSSGGGVCDVDYETGPGYQVAFSERIRKEDVLTAAVGEITDPHQAETVIRTGQADLVLLAREMLRDPYWPYHAARELGVKIDTPPQYQRGWRW
ncbi:MAG TPA: NADH:flavin oxidoreductase/NADH oxidase [Phycisphaerales bacterium]|nr:NADH:flavin oxidoreductase/NADH oxidase [Phycisphaerales bacterium]